MRGGKSMKLQRVAPVLLVKDLVGAAEYWRDKVGFSYDELYGEPPAFAMPGRDGLTVMLCKVGAGVEFKPNWHHVEKMWDAYFWVDDAEALYAELVGRGAKIDYEIYNAPHGCREFGIQDLDDHDIAFGQVLSRKK